jgi:hypothetical protein
MNDRSGFDGPTKVVEQGYDSVAPEYARLTAIETQVEQGIEIPYL